MDTLKWKISLIALGMVAVAASTAMAADRGASRGGANFNGGGNRAVSARPFNAGVNRSFAGSTNRSFISNRSLVNDSGRFEGARRRFGRRGWDDDWGAGFFGLNFGIPAGYYGYGYPAPNCWNSAYGFNGFWYDGYCQQYPPPY